MTYKSGDILPYFLKGVYKENSWSSGQWDTGAWDNLPGSAGNMINRNFINLAQHFYNYQYMGGTSSAQWPTFWYDWYSGSYYAPSYSEYYRYAIQMANMANFGRVTGFANPTTNTFSYSIPADCLGWGNYPIALFGSMSANVAMSSISSPSAMYAPSVCQLPTAGHFVAQVLATAADTTNRHTVGVVIEGYNLTIQNITKMMESKVNHTNGTVTPTPNIPAEFCASANFTTKAASGFLFTVYNNRIVFKYGGGFTTSTNVNVSAFGIPTPAIDNNLFI